MLKLPAGGTTQVELPFTALGNPVGVAVGNAGDIYVTDMRMSKSRVLKLPAGSSTQVELPFTGLNEPHGGAVGTAGNVYVTDEVNNRVLELPAR